MQQLSQKQVYGLMVLTALFWSGAFITGKLSAQQFPPFALTFFRFLFAFPIIFAILYWQQPTQWRPERRQWPPLIVLGAAGTFLYHGLFFYSLHHTTAVNSALIGAANPMATVLLASLFFKQRMRMRRLAGVILSFAGVLLTISGGDWRVLQSFQLNVGDISMLFAVISWAVYSLLSRRYMDTYALSPLMVTAYTFLVCTIVSLPLMLWEHPELYIPASSVGGWLSILYMAIFASVLGYLFQLIAIQHIGASKASIFINLVPIFTMVQSVVFLHEALRPVILVSAAIIISGVYLVTCAD